MGENQKGFTLIEILAALSILSIILLLASSVQFFGMKQSSNQAMDIQNQSNVRLALNILTKEIRKASSVKLDYIDDTSEANDQLTINGTDVYKLENNSITKNSQPLITNVQKFTLKRVKDKDGINMDNIYSITISNLPTNNSPQISLSTRFYIRK